MNHEKHHRRSIRLKGYDYSQAGAYFVTICVQNRVCLFGNIVDGKMMLNNAGRMVDIVWNGIPQYYSGIGIDTFQIMPNHIHGIITIVGAGPRACPDNGQSHNGQSQNGQPFDGQPFDGQPQGVAPTGLSLPDVVHRFKTMTTKQYIDGVKQLNWRPFNKRVWQRNYFEHIIRDEKDYNRICEYIKNNPLKWELDSLHPENGGFDEL